MAAFAQITAPRETDRKDGIHIGFKMAAAKIIKGGFVQSIAGYANYLTDTSDGPFLGVAIETVDNSGGAAGDKVIRVDTTGCHLMKGAGLAQADVGKKVWCNVINDKDNATIAVADPGAKQTIVGRISEVLSATLCYVRIDGYAMVEQAENA